MRVVIQRVSEASVKIAGKLKSQIKHGMMIFVGIENSDNQEDIEWLSKKICNLRIFDDENGVMNHSVIDVKGEILLISQFTLHARTKKGNRPSYVDSAKPEVSVPLYEALIKRLEFDLGRKISTGEFGAQMQVETFHEMSLTQMQETFHEMSLTNNGPVTIIIDTKNRQ